MTTKKEQIKKNHAQFCFFVKGFPKGGEGGGPPFGKIPK